LAKENDMNLIAKKQLRIPHQTTILFAMMLLASCSSRMPEGQITATAAPTELRSLTVTASSAKNEFLTGEPTVLPSENAHGAPLTGGPSPTVENLPPETILQFQPFEITSGASLNENPMGVLVLCGDFTIQLLHFAPEVKLETILESSDDVYCQTTSPDRKWIAYEQDSDESPTGRWLIVQSADGQQKKLPSDEHWIGFGDYVWLDNQHLIFNDFSNPPDVQRSQTYPAYPMVVINPFTGKQTKLASNYSELHLDISGPASSLDFNYSDVVYDPSLNLVIFPSWRGEHNYIVLWDRRSKTILANVETQSQEFGDYPLWSPDATQFVVPIVNAVKGNHVIEEWYSVSRQGQVEQLTYFGDYFSDSDISFANWSPDGRKLAFWLDVFPSPCPNLRLAILDTTTTQVIDTCLPGSARFASPPSWSFDSQYFVVRNYGASPVKTILVNSENGQAFDITSLIGDSYPTGWLH
jgi:hypothetical protein